MNITIIIVLLVILLWVIIRELNPTLDLVTTNSKNAKLLLWYNTNKKTKRKYIILLNIKVK